MGGAALCEYGGQGCDDNQRISHGIKFFSLVLFDFAKSLSLIFMRRNLHLLTVLLLLQNLPVMAREWRSADGKKSIEARFAALQNDRVQLIGKDGKPLVLPMSALSTIDQSFAKLAQVSAHGAATLGPQTCEIITPVDGGYIARMGQQLSGAKGPWVFTGETFFLPKNQLNFAKGDRLEAKPLFYAGNRTYQPLEGDAAVIRAFALDLDSAVEADLRLRAVADNDPAKLAPLVSEPITEIISTRGLALPLGKGFFVTEHELIKDAKTLMLHEDGKDLPAKVIKSDDKLGLALISSTLEMEPAKLIARKPAELGQGIYALALSLTKSGKDLGAPSLTRGIISQTSSRSSFEHDAALDPYTVGGYILNDKWEPLGFFFRSQSRTETVNSTTFARASNKTPQACIRTETIEALLMEGEKAEAKRRPGVPSLRPGSIADNAEAATDALKKSTALVIATREIQKQAPAKQIATPAGPPAQPGQLRYNLSSTGIRHNSNCRYFNPNKICQPTDGKPCKLCGG
jgi:hypothetical protein